VSSFMLGLVVISMLLGGFGRAAQCSS
jgi:hypothetical protein